MSTLGDGLLDVKMLLEGSNPHYPAHFVSEGHTRAKLLPAPMTGYTLPATVLQSIRDLALAYTPASIQGTPQAYDDPSIRACFAFMSLRLQ